MKKLQQKINRLEQDRKPGGSSEEKPAMMSAPGMAAPPVFMMMPPPPPLLHPHLHYEEPNKHKAHDFLNTFDNLDERALNTERRVMELEKQLDKMRRLLNKEIEKNPNLNHNNNSNEKNRRVNNFESDATLRDADQALSNEEVEAKMKNNDLRVILAKITIKTSFL